MSTYYKRSPINGRMIEHHLPDNVKNLKYTEKEIAKARATERAKVLSEVEKVIVIVDREERRQAFAKLNQLKGSE